jgi:hypothetical protein
MDSNSLNRYANTTYYYCGKKGHIVLNCPDKKKGKEIKGTHQKTEKKLRGHIRKLHKGTLQAVQRTLQGHLN